MNLFKILPWILFPVLPFKQQDVQHHPPHWCSYQHGPSEFVWSLSRQNRSFLVLHCNKRMYLEYQSRIWQRQWSLMPRLRSRLCPLAGTYQKKPVFPSLPAQNKTRPSILVDGQWDSLLFITSLNQCHLREGSLQEYGTNALHTQELSKWERTIKWKIGAHNFSADR